MQNYEVKLEHVGKTKSDPFGQKQWGASVRLGDGSGMCFFGETPQAALSGLAMYWAQSDVQDTRCSEGVQITGSRTGMFTATENQSVQAVQISKNA